MLKKGLCSTKIFNFSKQFLCFIYNKKIIRMGCGAVCGNQTSSSNKYMIYALAKMNQLLPRITQCNPLLTKNLYQQFSKALQSSELDYVLKVGERVGTNEDVSISIMSKWKIILYGLDKVDDNYKKCLNFQVRDEKILVTNTQNLINNKTALLENKSYHQLKQPTQYHQCFTQIEKDLNRTFQFKIDKKTVFENVLKRIANYFPSMGYTQGVNFVVGYLLVLGYSESDTFWMFVHLALNKRNMILGFYEDGFPLSYIYTMIFKNMLKRLDPQLQDHLYNKLMLDDSIWIFKWFITFYIYSFPFSMVIYAWNLVIELGSIALVYFAISLTVQIRDKLMGLNDVCDVSQFWQHLKDLNHFNKAVNIQRVVQRAYQLKMILSDLVGLDNLKQSFYKQFYKICFVEMKEYQRLNPKNKQNQTTFEAIYNLDSVKSSLNRWYSQLFNERKQFLSKEERQIKNKVPQLLKQDYEDLQKSIHLLEEKVIRNESMKLSKKSAQNIINMSEFFGQLMHVSSISQLDESKPSHKELTQDLRRFKTTQRQSYSMSEQINQVDGQSDSNQQLQQASYNISKKPTSSCIQQQKQQEEKNKEKINQFKYPIKINTIVGKTQIDHNKSSKQYQKANHITTSTNEKISGLGLAGKNILCNLSISNSQYTLSKNTSYKPKKQKQNKITPRCKNHKIKIDQISQPSIDHSSEYESSIDKQSLSGISNRIKQNPPRAERPKDTKTQQQIMINSHYPEHANQHYSSPKDAISQIEIFNGDGLFKKKKKIYSRNSNVTSLNHHVNEIYVIKMGINEDKKCSHSKIRDFHQQQSLDSILYPLSTRKSPNSKHTQSINYEIQSIK